MDFDTKKYKVYTWKNWMMLHWIINPGLAINELIIGQRVPKIILEDKSVKKPRIERTYYPCPHCKTMHDSRIWSTENPTAYKNWFGLYCRDCGNVIPCLMNVFSFLILALSFPIWGWFRKRMREKWLKQQATRYENLSIKTDSHSFDSKNWISTGLSFGILMFISINLVYPLLTSSPIILNQLAFMLILWLIVGLAFGYSLKWYYSRVPGTASKSAQV